jgi:hypothetical protein
LLLGILKKKSESKNHQIRVLEKTNQIQRTVSFGYFKNFKEPSGFLKISKN